MERENSLKSQLTTTVSPDYIKHNMHSHHNVNLNTHATHGNVHIRNNGSQISLQHMMSMTFHFGYNEIILFDWWKVNTISGLVVSMIAIFVLALLYEGLKYYREYLLWKTYNLLEYRPVIGSQANSGSSRSPPSAQTSNSHIQYVGEVIHKQPQNISLKSISTTKLNLINPTYYEFLSSTHFSGFYFIRFVNNKYKPRNFALKNKNVFSLNSIVDKLGLFGLFSLPCMACEICCEISAQHQFVL